MLLQFGVRTFFKASQDYSNFVVEHGSNFSVSKIIQEAFINVTEEGTEAAAATGWSYENFIVFKKLRKNNYFSTFYLACCIDGLVRFDRSFIANRPFYFCISNNKLLKLFDGCYRRPC